MKERQQKYALWLMESEPMTLQNARKTVLCAEATTVAQFPAVVASDVGKQLLEADTSTINNLACSLNKFFQTIQ